MPSVGTGDGPWRSEGLSIQVEDKEGGGVWWRTRLGGGCSKTYRLNDGFYLYLEGVGGQGSGMVTFGLWKDHPAET